MEAVRAVPAARKAEAWRPDVEAEARVARRRAGRGLRRGLAAAPTFWEGVEAWAQPAALA